MKKIFEYSVKNGYNGVFFFIHIFFFFKLEVLHVYWLMHLNFLSSNNCLMNTS